MKKTCMLDGELVTICGITGDRNKIYIDYIDSSNTNKTKVKYFEESVSDTITVGLVS